MAWTALKLNWTAKDYFNYADMDKIEKNVQAVWELMKSKNVQVVITAGVFQRNMWWIPYKEEFARVENNLETLRSPNTPIGWRSRDLPWTEDQPFGYLDLNRWERNLNLLWEYYSTL
ncbi:MAG TPA: hypothetical protein VGN87_00860 [Paenibacillus sp.]